MPCSTGLDATRRPNGTASIEASRGQTSAGKSYRSWRFVFRRASGTAGGSRRGQLEHMNVPDKLAQLLSKPDLEGAEPAGTDVTPDGLKRDLLRNEAASVHGFAAGTRTPAIPGRMIDHIAHYKS